MKNTYAEATITSLIQSISFGREKGLEKSVYNVKVLWKNALHSLTKLNQLVVSKLAPKSCI